MKQISNKDVIAIKDHKCYFCGGIIKKGEKYNSQFNICEGDPYSCKTHLHCIALTTLLKMDYNEEGITDDNFCEYIDDEFKFKLTTADKALIIYNKLKK